MIALSKQKQISFLLKAQMQEHLFYGEIIELCFCWPRAYVSVFLCIVPIPMHLSRFSHVELIMCRGIFRANTEGSARQLSGASHNSFTKLIFYVFGSR